MIHCPICHIPVLLASNGSHVEDNDDRDFFCPTSARMSSDISWLHYTRISHNWPDDSTEEIEYRAVIPPFEVSWLSKECYAEVRRVKFDYSPMPAGYTVNMIPICEGKDIDFQGFLKLYERFKNLRVFL